MTLYFAYRNPKTPWFAKGFTALIVAYAFSPIDLIPDFIPVLGYLDDLIIVPLGVALALKMIPAAIIAQSRAETAAFLNSPRPQFKIMAAVIVVVWIAIIFFAGWMIYSSASK